MRVGLSKSVNRHWFQTAIMLLRLKAVVVSDNGKGIIKSVRWVLRRWTQVNRWWGVERVRRCKNQGSISSLGQAKECDPVSCLCCIRHIDGASLIQAQVRNRRTCRCDVKRKLQGRETDKKENIKAQHGGGTSRSSDEVLVMRMERRGCIIWLMNSAGNWK